jgi:transcriptional regulator with XRE-family HTH domain
VVGTPEERTRVGRELQRLRNEQHLKQDDIADRADMSVGCVQAIEYNKWEVGIAKIERYAALFGTTADRLLYPKAMQPVDPLWRDLNDEHLAIARLYMKALKRVRTAVETLLTDEASARTTAADLAEMVLALKRVADHDPGVVARTGALLELDDLLVQLGQRLETDPTFESALRELLNAK